jgi:hypothetical protein
MFEPTEKPTPSPAKIELDQKTKLTIAELLISEDSGFDFAAGGELTIRAERMPQGYKVSFRYIEKQPDNSLKASAFDALILEPQPLVVPARAGDVLLKA